MEDLFSKPAMPPQGMNSGFPRDSTFQRRQEYANPRGYDSFDTRPNVSSFDNHPSNRFHPPQDCPNRRRLHNNYAGGRFQSPQNCPNRYRCRSQYESIPRQVPYAAPFGSAPRRRPHATPYDNFEGRDRDRGGGIGLDHGMSPESNDSPWESYECLRPKNECRTTGMEDWATEQWRSGDESERTGF